jgi:hypothetical protein
MCTHRRLLRQGSCNHQAKRKDQAKGARRLTLATRQPRQLSKANKVRPSLPNPGRRVVPNGLNTVCSAICVASPTINQNQSAGADQHDAASYRFFGFVTLHAYEHCSVFHHLKRSNSKLRISKILLLAYHWEIKNVPPQGNLEPHGLTPAANGGARPTTIHARNIAQQHYCFEYFYLLHCSMFLNENQVLCSS